MDIANREPIATLPEPAECKRLRELFGVTQQQAADHIGVMRQMVNRWERGRSVPSGENRKRYAELLESWARNENKLRTEVKAAGESIPVKERGFNA